MAQISIFNDNGMKFLGFQPHKADTGVSWEQHFFNYVQSINAVQLTPYQTTLLGKFRVSFEDLSILPRPASSYQLTIEVLHPGPVFGAQPQEKYVVEPSAPSFSGFVVFPIFLCSSDAMSPPIVVTNFRYTLIRKRSILSNVTESSGIFKLEGIIQRHTPLSAGRLALAPLSSGTQPTVTYNYTPLVGPNAPGGSMAPAGSMLQQQPVQSPAAYPRLDAYGQPPASVPAPVQAPALPMAAAVGGLAGTAATPAKCNQPGCTNYGNAKNEGMCNTCAEQLAKAAGVPAGQQLYQQPQQQQQQQYQPQQYQQQQYQQPLGMGSQYQQPQQPQQPVYQQAPSAPQAAAPLPEDDVAVQQQAHQTIVQSTPRCISSGCDNFGNTQKGGQCNSCHAKLSQAPQSLPQAQLQLQQPMYQFIGPQGGQVQAPQGLLPSYQSAQQPLPMTQALQQPVQQYQQPQLLQQPVQAQYQQAPQQFQQQLQPQQPQQLQQLQQPQQPQYQQFVQVQAPASLQQQQQAAQPAQQAQPPQPSVLEQQFQPVQQQLEQQFQQQQPQDQPSVQQQQPVQQQQQPALLQPVQQQQPMQQQPMQALEQPEPAQQQQLYQQVAQPSYQQPQQPQQQQEAQASPSAYAQYASLLSFDQNGNQSSQPGFAPGSGSVFQGMVSPQGN